MRRLLPILLFLSLSRCAPVHNEFGGAREEGVRSLLLKPESVDFTSLERFVLGPSCVSCHGSISPKDGVDLSNFASVMAGVGDRKLVVPYDAKGSALYEVLIAGGKRHMPPLDHPQISDAEKELVYTWIENGAKPSPGAAPARPPSLADQLKGYFANPETVDYGVVRKFILVQSCEKCHSLESPTKDIDAIGNSANLTNYQALFNVFTPVVVKGKPLESKLYGAMALTQSMPPAKEGYEPLDGLRLKLVRLWILNCAVESVPQGEELVHNPDNPEKVRLCESLDP